MITAPSTPPPTRRKLIPDSAGPSTDAPSISNDYAPPTPDSNTSSPRSAVVKRLSDLNLRSLDAETHPVRASPKRKRVRSADEVGNTGESERDGHGRVGVVQASISPPDVLDNLATESANLPYDREEKASGIGTESAAVATAPARRRVIAKPKPKRKQSPPSPPKAPNTRPDPHTWQEHEITGHLMQDPDDDGYGINGIGFRPTAAIAYERSQKRKMQLNAWKVRESSEARERRGERRGKLDGEASRPPSFIDLSTEGGHAGAGSKKDGESAGKRDARAVRFA